MTRPHLIRTAYFLWVPAALGLYAAYAAFGLPHVLFSYSFDVPAGGDPWSFKDRWYTRCTFVGPYGAFTSSPGDGRCPWVVFHREGDAGGRQ